MRLIALAVLFALPFLEIAAFTGIAGWTGLWPALSALVATTLAGVVLLRWQGPGTLARLNRALGPAEVSGEAAGVALIDALGLLIAGILLLAPGFVTDLMALPLAAPALRRWVGRFVISGLRGKTVFRSFVVTGMSGQTVHSPSGPASIIDGKFRDVAVAPSLPKSEPPRAS
ncbi:MAG: FxsA family protein [Alphaproteobacteria bacterium]|nr:FxsA family protein [Alphaproteobacteria bacterium]